MRRLRSAALALLALATLVARPMPLLADGFRRADGPWRWDLPRDHRSHPDFALEWWYITGHLSAEGGRELGYQATFFRNALVAPSKAAARTSPLAATQVLMWHGAVTDLSARTFTHDEILARDAAGWGGASAEALDVRVHDRRLQQVAPDRWELRARVEGWTLELDYLLDRPPVLHGTMPGLSFKGKEPGQASHYVSRVHLRTTGFVTPPGGKRSAVEGLSWFDQEWGSGQLAESQVGWDWFSVNLDDGSALMIYMLRERDGSVSSTSSGTFVAPDGTQEYLALPDIVVREVHWWTSPRTLGTYPAGWILEIPRIGLALQIEAALPDQERGGKGSATPPYWEGSCRFTGVRDGKAVAGRGYAELVGYAGDVLLR